LIGAFLARFKSEVAFLCLLLVSLSWLPIFIPSIAEASSAPLQINAESAILVHADTGKVLFEKDPHKQLHPASVAKIMTMLLAMEAVERAEVKLTDIVRVSERARATQIGTTIFLDVGEEISLETLLKGVAIESANDASVAVAEYIGGSVEAFVDMMNKRAVELGMLDTNFVNPSGLPPDDGPDSLTSAYDVAIMSREVLKYPKVHEWFTTWIEPIRTDDPKRRFDMVNKNLLVAPSGKYKYSGADGIKTGSHSRAGFCFSGTAKRGDLRLIAVIMKAPSKADRFAESIKLLDYGFSKFSGVQVIQEGHRVGDVRLRFGSQERVVAVASSSLNLILPRGQDKNIEVVTILPKVIDAPVAKGQVLGEIIAIKDGQELGRVDIIAAESVARTGFLRFIGEVVRDVLFKALFVQE
jgi:D-alanyl-D-alanine carboxypeptidase (penicillin-binding protein 5/6)